jgi:hypothetical protein
LRTFDEAGKTVALLDAVHGHVRMFPAVHGKRRRRDSVLREEVFAFYFMHRQGGGQHPGAVVGDAEAVEHSLDLSVLSEIPVQGQECGVATPPDGVRVERGKGTRESRRPRVRSHIAQGCDGLGRRDYIARKIEEKVSVPFRDDDHAHVVLAFVDIEQNLAAREQGDFVLGRRPAQDYR